MAMAFAAPAAEEVGGAVAARAGASKAAKAKAGSSTASKASSPSSAPSKPSKPQGSKKVEIPEVPSSSSKKSSEVKTPKVKSLVGKVGNKKLLLPELILCLTTLVFGTLVAPKDSKDDVHRMIVKGSALMGVFFILAIMGTGGKGTQKIANMLGLLITLAYLLNSSDIHNVVNWVNGFFKKPGTGKAN